MKLPDHCLSVPGCRAPRLPYAGHCAAHGPVPMEWPKRGPGRCVAPLRCYCLRHLGGDNPRNMLGPDEGPESIRLRLAALDERRRATLSIAQPVT